MRWYRGAEGDRRIWFDEGEIELIMEDELGRAGRLPTLEAPAVDIEGFIEDYLKVALDQYASLEAAVLGLTEFASGVLPVIRINKDLTGSAMDADWCPPGIEGRWRATLAHEAAHVLLHRVLFEGDPDQTTLFEVSTVETARELRCLKRDVAYRGRSSDWREVQANRGMAALLMPKTLFAAAARAELLGAQPFVAEVVARRLAARFEVSREACAIRLRTLGFLPADGVIQGVSTLLEA